MNKYNGWSNYETWNFKLWLDNDEGVHNYIMDKIKKISSQKFDNKISQIADFLKSYIEDNMPNLNVSSKGQSLFGSIADKNGFYQDILNMALKDINTYEIAESYLEEQDGYTTATV